MKKMLCLISVIAVIFTLVSIPRIKDDIAEAKELQAGISESIIRFHVRANSDSEEDQAVKLKVKEAVIEYIKPMLDGAESLEDSRSILLEESENIQELALSVLRDSGFDYAVKVYFEDAYFPVKAYGDVTFPAGYYEAFRVDIGEAEGKNWWCVLYPPLCFVDATYGVVPEKSKETLANVLTEDEYRAVSGKNCKVRCKYITVINRILERF